MAFHLFLVDSKVESQVKVQDVIRAKRIEIVNSKGQPVVSLWDSGFFGGAIGVYDRDGTLIVEIASPDRTFPKVPKGGAVTVYNQDGTRVASMGTYSEGGGVSVYNQDGTISADFFTGKKGGTLSICKNKIDFPLPIPIVSIGTDLEGRGEVSVYNQDGTRVAYMFSDEKGGGVISVLNKDGKGLGSIP